MGIALEKLGDLRGAVLAYDRATELKPSLTEAWFRAGALVYTLGHRKEAIGCFRRAAATGPEDQLRTPRRGAGALDRGSRRGSRTGLAADPGGRPDERHGLRPARQPARRVRPFRRGPRLLRARDRDRAADGGKLLRSGPVSPGHDRRRAVSLPGWKPPSPRRGWKRRNVCGFTSRSARRRTISATTPWRCRHFDAADAVRRGSASFDSAAFDTEIDRMIDRCTPDLIARAPELGSGDATPVLIVGMPRSGTTLVEQIVSSHPEVGAGGELNFWNERGAAWHGTGPAGTEAPFLGQCGGRVSRRAARDRAEGGAGDRQDAVQLPLGRAHPPRTPARDDHPLPPRRHRHGAVDPPDPVPPGPGVSDRRRRTCRVFPELPAADRPLAAGAAARIGSSRSITRT